MARDPGNLVKVNFNPTKREVKKFDIVPDYDIEDFDLDDPKKFNKYIGYVEKLVRGSFEYQSFIQYLKMYADMNRCTFLKNVSLTDSFKIHIEIHHEPLTLYDITMAVYNKRRAYNEDLEACMVAKEIAYYHYKLYVGLIPLSETVHELVHNQYIFVPTNAVFGRYKEFIKGFKPFIDEETLSIMDKIEKLSENYNLDEVEKLLTPHIITIDTTGANRMPDKVAIMEFLKENLEKLKPGM